MAQAGYEGEHREEEATPGFPAVYIDDASCDLIWASGMWVTDAPGFVATMHQIPDPGQGSHPGVVAGWQWPRE